MCPTCPSTRTSSSASHQTPPPQRLPMPLPAVRAPTRLLEEPARPLPDAHPRPRHPGPRPPGHDNGHRTSERGAPFRDRRCAVPEACHTAPQEDSDPVQVPATAPIRQTGPDTRRQGPRVSVPRHTLRATTYAGRYGLAQDERGSPFWLREPLLQGGGGFVEGDGPVQQSADDLCDRHVDLMSRRPGRGWPRPTSHPPSSAGWRWQPLLRSSRGRGARRKCGFSKVVMSRWR